MYFTSLWFHSATGTDRHAVPGCLMDTGKDLLTLMDFSSERIDKTLRLARDLKARRLCDEPQVLSRRTGVLLFEKPSLRTRITFETGIHELGGHPLNLEPHMVQLGKRETVADVARNLDRWVHLIVARTYAHETLEELARRCSAPVVNALTDRFHPCQALAFALTVREHLSDEKHINTAFVGDGNNVCVSIMVVCARLGYSFILACPDGYAPPEETVEQCRRIASSTGSEIKIVREPREAVANASIIYTDVWTSMGQEQEKSRREKAFASYQVNKNLLSEAPAEALVSHCLPAHRGEEITGEVLDSPRCIAFDEAENRLYVQKAVIVRIFT